MPKKKSKILENIKAHIYNNVKSYAIIIIIFAVGVFLGVMFVNQISNEQKVEIENYINNYIEDTKKIENINYLEEIRNDTSKNIILTFLLWFAGTTVIGIPIVFGIIAFRGFCLGYTIAGSVYALGHVKGIIFILISLLLQNIIFIPALLVLGVSSIRLYKSIIKDKRKENIKFEIIRHSAISLMILAVIICSSIIKVQCSYRLIKYLIKYF